MAAFFSYLIWNGDGNVPDNGRTLFAPTGFEVIPEPRKTRNAQPALYPFLN